MIETTLRRISMSAQALNKFGELPFDARTKFRHGGLLDELGQLLQSMDKLRKEAIEKHGGVADKDGKVEFADGREAFDEEWNDLLDEEQKLDYAPVRFEVFETLPAEAMEKFTANDFAVLSWMITE